MLRLTLLGSSFVLLTAMASSGCASDGDATPWLPSAPTPTNGSQTPTGSGASDKLDATECASRCEARATACQAPASLAQSACASVCANDLDEAQASCLESSGCQQLEDFFFSSAPLCGIGEQPSTGGGACDPGCDGNTQVTCNGDMEVRTTCHVLCDGGTCKASWEVCQPGWSDSDGACPETCNNRDYAVDGNRYCTATCGSGGKCPSGTACDPNNLCRPNCSPGAPGACPGWLRSICPDSGFCGD